MYRLFEKGRQFNKGTVNPASHINTRNRLRHNLIKVLRYIRGAKESVSSNHLLVKLLIDLRLNPSLPLFDFYRQVTARSLMVAKAHGLTSSLHRGKTYHEGNFFGSDVKEIIFVANEPIDLLKAENEWTSYQSVKILRHPSDDISLAALNGKHYNVENGIAVIQIDIVKLALQFRFWYNKQVKDDVQWFETTRLFVPQYPLGNALISVLDYAVLNRFKTIYDGNKPEAFKNHWPIQLTDWSRDINTYLIDRMVFLTRKQMSFEDILTNISLVSSDTAFDVVQLPLVPHVRQVTWVLVSARVPIVKILVDINKDTSSARNTTELSDIRKTIRELRNDRDLPQEIRIEIQDQIESVIKT